MTRNKAYLVKIKTFMVPLIKALYGLYQASRAWYATLSTFLVQSGYRRGLIDKTLFIKKDKKDIILSKFQMSSMGELTFFFGLQVKQKEDGIFICQDKYVAEILKKFDFISVKTTSTPIETKKTLVKDEEATDVDIHLYRSMISSLMYLSASRLDIMYGVCACSRVQVTPKTSHLHVVKRIFRILISWQCKKQTIIATSTIEAEYVVAASYWSYTHKVKVINAEAEGVRAAVEILTAATLTVLVLLKLFFIGCEEDERRFNAAIDVVKSLLLKEYALLVYKCWFFTTPQMVINSPCLTNKKELAIPEQTTTGKELSNPLMADSLPKTTLPTKLMKVNAVRHTLTTARWKLMLLRINLQLLVIVTTVEYDLKLNDVEGTSCLSNVVLFEELARMSDPLPSGEDIMKLKELMDLRTNLSNKVLDLENKGRKIIDIDADAEVNLENVYNLNMAHEEIVLSMQDVDVQSERIDSDVKEVAEEMVEGRKIIDIDADTEVNLENVYNLNMAHEEIVLSMQDVDVQSERIDSDVKEVAEEMVEVMEIAKIIVDEVSTIGGELNAANEKPVSVAPTNITTAQPSQARKNMMIYLKNMAGFKMDFFKGMSYEEIRPLFEKEYNKDNAKKQKLGEQEEAEELKKNLEIVSDDEDDVFVNVTPLSSKEDLEVLWKIVKDRFKKSQQKEVLDVFLWHTLKVMFEHTIEDNVWKHQKGPQGLTRVKNWKLFDSCGVYCVTLDTIQLFLLAEKMYPLTNYTLQQMFNKVRLQVDYEVEMAYDLLRLVRK
nr:hypothetical protein [Tanacetum cinerariifolium]